MQPEAWLVMDHWLCLNYLGPKHQFPSVVNNGEQIKRAVA